MDASVPRRHLSDEMREHARVVEEGRVGSRRVSVDSPVVRACAGARCALRVKEEAHEENPPSWVAIT